MIFSKDKKPTEPGWWWMKAELDKSPVIVEVMNYRDKLIAFFSGDEQEIWVKDWPVLWGDRIELPTVEVHDENTPYILCPGCGWKLVGEDIRGYRRDLICMNAARLDCNEPVEYHNMGPVATVENEGGA